LLDWFTSALIICLYLALGLMFANAAGGGAAMPVLVPQLISAFLVFPLVSLLVSGLDKLRLIPIVDLD
jgi:hypothetical protein